MESSIMKVYGSLQAELEKAKEDLKGVEENIKKIIGRDPNDGPPSRQDICCRTVTATTRGRERQEDSWTGRGAAEVVRPSVKKRLGDPKTVFSRLSGPPRYRHDENMSGDEDSTPVKGNKPSLSSQVNLCSFSQPSRQEVITAQGADEHSKARNRRMFGALLGTLHKFRQEETRLKDREQKKAQVEKQLEEAARREKDELKRERQELFQNRKRRQAEIRNIELKMARIQEQENWEKLQKPLLNFIQTRSKPYLYYLPKTHNAKTEERLASSQKSVTKMIEKKRKEVQEEVAAILKRGMGPHMSSVVNAGGEAKSANDLGIDYEDDEEDEDVNDEEVGVVDEEMVEDDDDNDEEHDEQMNVDLGDKENIAVLPDLVKIKKEKVEDNSGIDSQLSGKVESESLQSKADGKVTEEVEPS
ncbi:pinin [Nilaparvata lugens]|uniref:pinin n=1 Tax=Nilaparvata lugens TaxID=108931 RepID=UPI00193D3D61|nr:pinin [Nilaparvata lugens]